MNWGFRKGRLMEFQHISVLLQECMDGLNIDPNGVYVDGTAGGAGHSSEIARKLTAGRLFALDQDPDAVKTATERLAKYPCAKVIQTNFTAAQKALQNEGFYGVDGFLLDLGVSSHQLDEAERGFSYHTNAPLDMRMSQSGISARDIVNNYSEEQLSRILWDYGEEKFTRRIVSNIIKAREEKEIETTFELADIIRNSVPASVRREKNPCKKTFQAIRIAVNAELSSLSEGLRAAFELLNSNGRLVVITFHSLEDRIVKRQFLDWCKGCTCPSDFPQCVCGNKPKAKIINRKPIIASEAELENNKRSHSAKLRILEKI